MKKFKQNIEGFTLIELIVVFAIVAVLAGVGSVTYTGYIKRANQSVDQQSVANLIYATKLANYADTSLLPDGGSAVIAITDSGTKVAGGSDSDALKSALEDSMGSLDNIQLAYDGWGGAVNGTTLKSMVASLYSDAIGFTDQSGSVLYTDSEGNAATTSYAASADELWETVKEYAASLASSSGETESYYVAKAATYTLQVVSSADAMGSAWATETTDYLSNLLTQAYANTYASSLTAAEKQALAAAGEAARVARNHAFAEYLKTASSLDSAVITLIASSDSDYVPVLINSRGTAAYGVDATLASVYSDLYTYAKSYLNDKVYSKSGSQNYSQAYVDGVIYYALMYNIENAGLDYTDDSYFDDLASYVSVAGTALSGTVDWDSMYTLASNLGDGTAIVITATKDSNGVLTFETSPSDADVTDGQGASSNGDDDDSSAYTLTFNSDSVSVSTGSSVKNTFTTTISSPTITASSSDTSVATASSTYSAYETTYVTVAGVSAGTATITVTATDSSGNTATGSFEVTVSTKSAMTLTALPSAKIPNSGFAWVVRYQVNNGSYYTTAQSTSLAAGSVITFNITGYTPTSGTATTTTVNGTTVTSGTSSYNGSYTIANAHTGTVSVTVNNGTYDSSAGTITVGTSGSTVITVTITDNDGTTTSASLTYTINIQ